MLNTEVTRYPLLKCAIGNLRRVPNRLCLGRLVARAFFATLQQRWMTFKDKWLFELGNSFNGSWPIADCLNGGSSTTGSRAEP